MVLCVRIFSYSFPRFELNRIFFHFSAFNIVELQNYHTVCIVGTIVGGGGNRGEV